MEESDGDYEISPEMCAFSVAPVEMGYQCYC